METFNTNKNLNYTSETNTKTLLNQLCNGLKKMCNAAVKGRALSMNQLRTNEKCEMKPSDM